MLGPVNANWPTTQQLKFKRQVDQVSQLTAVNLRRQHVWTYNCPDAPDGVHH